MKKWLIVVMLALFPTFAVAETTNFTIVGYITELKAMPSAIQGAPTLVLLKRRGIRTDEGVEKALYQMECVAFVYKDYTEANGTSLYTYDDGSTQVLKWEYIGKDENGDGLSEGKGKGNYISGTGRFAGMKGTAVFEARYLTPYAPDKGTLGDTVISGTADYTVSQ